MADDQLATYLNDHHAGAAGARDLVEKSAANNEGSELGMFWSSLLTEIEEDIATLVDVMDRLDVKKATLKQAAGKIGEKLSRVKLQEKVTGDAGITRLLELESVAMGITGKAALWDTLSEVARTDPRLRGVDLPRLRTRARDQYQGVQEQHRQVAGSVFAG